MDTYCVYIYEQPEERWPPIKEYILNPVADVISFDPRERLTWQQAKTRCALLSLRHKTKLFKVDKV